MQRTPNSRARLAVRSGDDGQTSAKQPCLSPALNSAVVVASSADQLHVKLEAADTSTHL